MNAETVTNPSDVGSVAAICSVASLAAHSMRLHALTNPPILLYSCLKRMFRLNSGLRV